MNTPERKETAREIIDEIRRKGEPGHFTEGMGSVARVSYQDMRDYAERLESAISRETANVAKLLEAIEEIRGITTVRMMAPPIYSEDKRILEISESALAQPARNCDRFHSPSAVKEAVEVWWREYSNGNPFAPTPLFSLVVWLLSPVTRGVTCPKCDDGLRGLPDCKGCHADCVAVRNANSGGE